MSTPSLGILKPQITSLRHILGNQVIESPLTTKHLAKAILQEGRAGTRARPGNALLSFLGTNPPHVPRKRVRKIDPGSPLEGKRESRYCTPSTHGIPNPKKAPTKSRRPPPERRKNGTNRRKQPYSAVCG